MARNKPAKSMMGIASPTASHLPILERAVHDSADGLVIEHGAGLYSTPLLARLGRPVLCSESHPGWLEWAAWIYQGKAEIVDSWKDLIPRLGEASVLFVDGAASERGPIIQAALDCGVPFIVAHDTNKREWYHYGYQPHMFKVQGYEISHSSEDTHQTTLWVRRSS